MAKENKSKAAQLINNVQDTLDVNNDEMIEIWQNAIDKYGSEDEIAKAVNQAIKAAIASVFIQDSQMFKCGGKLAALFRKFGNGGKCGCGKVVKGQDSIPGGMPSQTAWPSIFKEIPIWSDGMYNYDNTMYVPKLMLKGGLDKQKQARKSVVRVPDNGLAKRRKVGVSIPAVAYGNIFPQSVSNIVYESARIGRKGNESDATTYAIAGYPQAGDTSIIQNVGTDKHVIVKGSPEYDTIMSRLREYFPEYKCGGSIKMHQQGKEIAKSLKCGGKTKKKK